MNKIYVVIGEWVKFDDSQRTLDFDYWTVKALNRYEEAMEFIEYMNYLVTISEDYDEAIKYDSNLNKDYVDISEVEYIFEECDVEMAL